MRNNWIESEQVLALSLYLQKVPFSKINRNNPLIIKLASFLGRTPSAVALKLANLANCDPAIIGTGRSGMSHGSKMDKVIWDKYITSNNVAQLFLDTIVAAKEYSVPDYFFFDQEEGNIYKDISTNNSFRSVCNIDSTEVFVTTKQRLGQNFFRKIVLNNFNNRCAITDLNLVQLIEASHIIPWESSSDEMRLSPKNGIALNVLLHRAYDANLLGIDQDLIVHISQDLVQQPNMNISNFFENIDHKKLNLPQIFIPNQDWLKIRFESFKRDN